MRSDFKGFFGRIETGAAKAKAAIASITGALGLMSIAQQQIAAVQACVSEAFERIDSQGKFADRVGPPPSTWATQR